MSAVGILLGLLLFAIVGLGVGIHADAGAAIIGFGSGMVTFFALVLLAVIGSDGA